MIKRVGAFFSALSFLSFSRSSVSLNRSLKDGITTVFFYKKKLNVPIINQREFHSTETLEEKCQRQQDRLFTFSRSESTLSFSLGYDSVKSTNGLAEELGEFGGGPESPKNKTLKL